MADYKVVVLPNGRHAVERTNLFGNKSYLGTSLSWWSKPMDIKDYCRDTKEEATIKLNFLLKNYVDV